MACKSYVAASALPINCLDGPCQQALDWLHARVGVGVQGAIDEVTREEEKYQQGIRDITSVCFKVGVHGAPRSSKIALFGVHSRPDLP
jgi:hypothetical protein